MILLLKGAFRHLFSLSGNQDSALPDDTVEKVLLGCARWVVDEFIPFRMSPGDELI